MQLKEICQQQYYCQKIKKKKRGGRTFFQEVTHRQKYSVSILMRRGSTHQHFSYLPKYLQIFLFVFQYHGNLVAWFVLLCSFQSYCFPSTYMLLCHTVAVLSLPSLLIFWPILSKLALLKVDYSNLDNSTQPYKVVLSESGQLSL